MPTLLVLWPLFENRSSTMEPQSLEAWVSSGSSFGDSDSVSLLRSEVNTRIWTVSLGVLTLRAGILAGVLVAAAPQVPPLESRHLGQGPDPISLSSTPGASCWAR